MKIECINKVRNTDGSILYYEFKAENGNHVTANKEDIVKEMKTHEFGYEFTNLQLDKIGRLVDKKENPVDEEKVKMEIRIFMENAYKMMVMKMKDGKQIGLTKIKTSNDRGIDFYDMNDETYSAYSRINNAVKEKGYGTVSEDKFISGFEKYLKSNKINCLKMIVKSKGNTGFADICYGMDMVNLWIQEIWLKNFSDKSPDLLKEENLSVKYEAMGTGKNEVEFKKINSDTIVKNGLAMAVFYRKSKDNEKKIRNYERIIKGSKSTSNGTDKTDAGKQNNSRTLDGVSEIENTIASVGRFCKNFAKRKAKREIKHGIVNAVGDTVIKTSASASEIASALSRYSDL